MTTADKTVPILDVLVWPDDRLRIKSEPVTDFNSVQLVAFIETMANTMILNQGIGLSAIQVGIPKKIIVIDLKDCPPVIINPEILEKQGEVTCQEGCLSVPGYYDNIKRAEAIKLKYQNEHGTELTIDLTGLPAICVQHEMDHLNGVVFIDYISKIKYDRIRRKIKKTMREKK